MFVTEADEKLYYVNLLYMFEISSIYNFTMYLCYIVKYACTPNELTSMCLHILVSSLYKHLRARVNFLEMYGK